MKQHQKVFSLPINPKLDKKFIDEIFIPFLLKNQEYIFDLYFTCRMPPFEQDAMGDLFEDNKITTYNSFYISEQSGIPLSATFNNIFVRPDQENLDLFIKNFRYVYDKGVRIATIPHTSWLLTGQIQKEFPELYIKNTILREVTRPNEIVSLAKAGFNYINLDRDLMRDRDQLLAIKEAKEYCASIGKPVKLSLLANENCWGGCPIMPEHYHYNNTRKLNNPEYFGDAISRVSCSTWSIEDSSSSLKAANIPPWKKDWEEFLEEGIDVFKMHGRESAIRLNESMDIISKWANDEELLFSNFNEYIHDIHIENKPIDIWREKIKNCKFNCWKCNYCESVIESRVKKYNKERIPLVYHVMQSLEKSGRGESNFNEKNYNIEGLSSNRVRHFLNNLCSHDNSIYLEIGCYAGSTFFAANMNNDILSFAVDSYETQQISPARLDISWKGYKNAKNEFINNSKKFKQNYKLIDKKIELLEHKDILFKHPNIIFYDGSHDYKIQKQILKKLLPMFDKTFVLIIDDANFENVVKSAQDFISESNLNKLYERQLLTTKYEDSSSWWNGLYISILSKPN
jgi:hypothetical protein